MELATFNGCQLSIILAGHPKLTNMLALSSNEEIGARTKTFNIDQVMGSMEHYIEWLLKHNLLEKVKINEIIHPDAIKELATALITPLQIHKYLLAALEIAYIAGIKPITKEVITKSLAPDLDSIEALLARSGYSFSAICELLNAPAQEVRNFLLGKAHSSRKSEFLNIIRSIHITV